MAAYRRTAGPALLWGFLLLCAPLFGIDRDRRIDQLHHTSWTSKDGAPGEVRVLAQTTDGYLWLGTENGLFRFDGLHFELYKPPSGQPFPPRSVYSLLALPDGGLWVGFWAGGVSFLKDGLVKTYGGQDGLPSDPIRAFVRDRRGVTWIAAGYGGLARLEGARWQQLGADWNFSGSALSIFEDRNGTLWVGTLDKVLFLPPGARKFQTAAHHLKRGVFKLGEASDGIVWMAETGRSVRPVPLQRKTPDIPASEIQVGAVSFLFDSQGSLWVASLGDGMRRIPSPELLNGLKIGKLSPKAEIFTQKLGLSSDYVYCVLQDREGNIWTGTTVGLDRFRQSPLVPVLMVFGPPFRGLVAADFGGVWAAVENRPLIRIRDGNITTPVPRMENAIYMYRGPDGVIWIANYLQILRLASSRTKPPGLSGRTRDDLVTSVQGIKVTGPVSVGEGLELRPMPRNYVKNFEAQTHINAMAEDRFDRPWFSITGKGVFRLDGLELKGLEDFGGPKRSASSAFTAPDGRIWFGFADGTVAVLDDDRVQTFAREGGATVGEVMSFGSLDQNVWIGGEDGLALFNGAHFRSVVAADGNPLGGVSGIVPVQGDGLWISERRGVIHIPEIEIRAFQRTLQHQVAFETYGLLDGLPAEIPRTHVLPTAVQATDGTIWFATSRGLAWVNPRRLSKNTLPPPVSIETIVAQGRTYSSWRPLELPARTKDLQISYTALSLTVPERIRFRYWLEGQDQGWRDVGSRREAIYTNLGPGTYRFRVIACNNDSVWNETGAALDFTIAPTFYQTWWFKGLCGIAAAGALWLIYLLRMNEVAVQFQLRLDERLAERERIARELHDTLLQGVQGLMLHFDAAMKQLPPHGSALPMMEKAMHIADQVVLEGRERVRGLRSEAIPSEELSMLLARCGEELAAGSAKVFKLAIVGSSRALNPIVLDEMYRIGREALLNAFRHSMASRIEVEITYDRVSLQLRIRDDGRGIDQETLENGMPGHWGLSGMRERAQKLGGQLGFWSRHGAGTEVDLSIPARLAYAPRLLPSRWYSLKRTVVRRHNQ